MSNESLANLLREERKFAPPAALAANANVTAEAYEQAEADRLGFWAEQARRLTWATEPTETLDWSNPPFAKWFADGKLNVAYNCVDRHVEAGNGDRVAIHFEGEPGDSRAITYAELKEEVSRAANALTELGVGKGDRVAVYLPMIPEAAVAMLACARIGATHSVVFGGFSADAIATRIQDADAKVVITADGGYRRGKPSALKPAVDDAVSRIESVEHVLVVRRTGQDTAWTEGRDVWWHEITARQSAEHTPEAFEAEQPLFILYTSGTTGKPKGILHTSGGYLTQAAYTHHAVFDLKPETDVYWCTADVGWVTGHSYIVYGPLANGATQVMYEGTPDTPHQGRFWEIVQKYGVTILYTAPTAIRTFMKWGDDIPAKFDLSSLRVLGSVGEPINPEAWMWYRKNIGADKCPIVDTWWQTETGAMMISPLPGVTETKPGSAQRALPGIAATVVDDEANEVPNGGGGYLVLTEPWPSMLRTDLGRRPAVPRHLLVALRGEVLRGRRCQEGRGRRRLAARPRRRRHARVRPQHLDHRGRVGARLPPVGRRGGRGRGERRDDRPGHRRVRDPAGHGDHLRRTGRGAAQPRRHDARPDRETEAGPAGRRASQDALRQDHAPPPPRRRPRTASWATSPRSPTPR
ncbi:Acetyl-coenzyme A synthetase [Streptomyces cyaneofuscatus]